MKEWGYIYIYFGCWKYAWCIVYLAIKYVTNERGSNAGLLGDGCVNRRYSCRSSKQPVCSASTETRDAAGNTHLANITSSRELLLGRVTIVDHTRGTCRRSLTQHRVALARSPFLSFFSFSLCLFACQLLNVYQSYIYVTIVCVCPHVISFESFLSL